MLDFRSNSIQHKWTAKPRTALLVIKPLEWDYTFLDILPSFLDRYHKRQLQLKLDQEEEEEDDSPMISWKAVLMGYGCGLVIRLIGTHNYYENEKEQEKILVCRYLQDSKQKWVM
ncbi:hypothetical protein H5410_000280 [Solanum commersonii]|uniref:Uncharacterized protein n=1 Tax=Solanum commersonii TaxID=4109 RepID=A0A9J6AWE9_SOLCO|nr:hypothetical protein H5410_000280 [Solanum commersonii]